MKISRHSYVAFFTPMEDLVMANCCVVCGKELSESESNLGKTCNDFACWESVYCLQPVEVEFEKIVLDVAHV